jgi:hypothetical protein
VLKNFIKIAILGQKIGSVSQFGKWPETFWMQTKHCPIEVHAVDTLTLQ